MRSTLYSVFLLINFDLSNNMNNFNIVYVFHRVYPHVVCILTSSWVLVGCVLLSALGCLFIYMDILSR